MFLQMLAENIKLIGGCATGLVGVCTGYVYMDGPVPASRNWTLAQKAELEVRVIDSQLQTNTVQRNMLRKEKFDREIEVQKDPGSSVRGIIQQRLDVIHDELDVIDKEREELQKEKRSKR